MEMTKKPTESQQRPPQIAPSPFPSSEEREVLERALLSSSAADASSASSASAVASQNYFVPTAVPILADNDAFDENGVPVMASAVAAAATSVAPADLPPPPAAMASTGRIRTAAPTTNNRNNNANNGKKSESFIDYNDDDVIVRPEPPSSSFSYNNDNILPSAPTLPTHTTHLPSTQQITTSAQIRAANVFGAISSSEENQCVARTQRQVKNNVQYHTNQGVKVANEIANRKAWREDEGLTVDEGIHHLNLNATSTSSADNEQGKKKSEEKDEDVRPYAKKGGGGYEVKEYETSEYDTSEYDVTEYKSVYD